MDPLDELMAAAGCTPAPVNAATRQDARYAAAMRDHVRSRWADAVADRSDGDDEADMVHATMAGAPAPPADDVRDFVTAWATRIQQSWAPAPPMPVTLDAVRDAMARMAALREPISTSDLLRRAGLGYAPTLWSVYAVTPPPLRIGDVRP